MPSDLLARCLSTEEQNAGVGDRQGHRWFVFDVDGTREAARQRAFPHTPDRPAPQQRLRPLGAPGSTGRTRGEGVRTRTPIVHRQTHLWVALVGTTGNEPDREDLRRATAAMQASIQAHDVPAERPVLCLDGPEGTGAVVSDLADVSSVTCGTNDTRLDRADIQARVHRPADQHLSRARCAGSAVRSLTAQIAPGHTRTHRAHHGSDPPGPGHTEQDTAGRTPPQRGRL
jgi:hypothetical protein